MPLKALITFLPRPLWSVKNMTIIRRAFAGSSEYSRSTANMEGISLAWGRTPEVKLQVYVITGGTCEHH
jgi:hypothetical protein